MKGEDAEGWVRDVWIYPDTGDMSEIFSAWERKVPGTVGDRFEHWERQDFRTKEERQAILDTLVDPLSRLYPPMGTVDAAGMADAVNAEEEIYEEQAKRFAEEAKG